MNPNKHLRRKRELRGWSQEDVAERLRRLAPRVGEKDLPVSGGMVGRWERGVRPRRPYPELLCYLFEATAEDLGLIAPEPGEPQTHAAEHPMRVAALDAADCPSSVSDLVRLAAADSANFVREIAAASNRALLLEQLHADVHRLAVEYLTAPPADVVAEVRPIRETVFRVLRQERHPTDEKDLLLASGYLSGILAYASLDLGFDEEAVANARAAWLAADLAGHNGLRAWVRGTQSLIARWQSDYHSAYHLIESGSAYAGDGTSVIRLKCGEAQCLAQFGDSAGTHRALNEAKDARERVGGIDAVGGVFGFPQAKQSYYSGSSLIWLPGSKDARVAEEESETAIELWQAGSLDERSSGDEALAHVYLATARMHLAQLDGVLEAIQPVLAIPVEQRISWHGKRLARIEELVGTKRYRTSATAELIRSEIEAFRMSLPHPESPAG